MFLQCISLTVLLALTSAFKLQHFALTYDYNTFFDRILVSIENQNPDYLQRPSLNFVVTQKNISTPVASFSSLNPILGSFRSVRRVSEVDYRLTSGNMTLCSNVSFGNLIVSMPGSRMNFFDQNFDLSAIATVRTNLLQICFTVYSKPDGSCAADLWHAKFGALDNIGINFVPLGIFNQFHLTVQMNRIDKAMLDQFKIDTEYLQKSIASAVCSQLQVTNGIP